MEEEMRASANNETWDLVEPPWYYKSISCKWVYMVKYNADTSINRYKAWLVAKGYAQTHEIDDDDTLALVVKVMTVHMVLAVAAEKGWHLH